MKTKKVRIVAGGGYCQLEADAPVASGGEANIYSVRGDKSLLAKVYIKPTVERAEKLACMLANPPRNPTEAQNHRSYAWPTALISSRASDKVIGFLMPRVTDVKCIFDFYNPCQRRQTSTYFDYRYLNQTRSTIAGIMAELHSKRYVVGDVSQKNVFVSDSALVTLLDTDSFQIRDPKSGQLHRCYVRSPGFIAPEAFKVNPIGAQRQVEEDLFGLGVLVFHLLMEGVHPFSCLYPESDEPPRIQQSIVLGNFAPGRPAAPFKPIPTAPPFDMLAPGLRQLFIRCFVDGHTTPSARPTAKEWQKELSKASQELKVCSRNSQHHYAPHLGDACPWCARIGQGFRDSFPPHPPPPVPSVSLSLPESPVRRRWWFYCGLIAVLLLVIRACS